MFHPWRTTDLSIIIGENVEIEATIMAVRPGEAIVTLFRDDRAVVAVAGIVVMKLGTATVSRSNWRRCIYCKRLMNT